MEKRDRWNERYAGKELMWSAGPNMLFAELAREVVPGRALDVAAGEGRNALWLAEQGWQVDAIDFSDVGIEKGRQIADRRQVSVNWIVDDVSIHDFGLHQYDMVAALYLHTAPEERASWLQRIIDAVRPGGSFVYIGHDPSNIEHGVGGPQDPDLLPGLGELKPLLAGFDFMRAEVFRREVDSDPGHGGPATGIALDTLIWAVRPGV